MRHCGRRPVPLGHAIAIVAGVAAGLHYAHERRDGDGASLGLIHRDVTPSNIMVGLDGCAKLLDFGIAKATFCRSDTAPGELKGKLPYMAPELFMDQPVDRRSDIFSLGVVLYELTTGSLLFDAPRESDILHQILYRELPRPSERCAGYPRRLEEIVLQALARAPAQRFSSAHELRRALESFAREERLPVFASSLGEYASQIADTLGVADQEAPPEPATLRAAAVVVSRRRRGRRMWRALVPVTAACLLAGVALSRLGTRHRSASELAAPSPRERIVTRAPIDFAPQIVSRAAAPSRHIAPTSVSRPAIRRSKSPRPPVAATPDPPPERSWSPDSIFLPGHER